MRDRLSASSFLPRRSRRSRGSGPDASKPTISGPVGPVRHIGGSDIQRAKEFTVISSINDAKPARPSDLQSTQPHPAVHQEPHNLSSVAGQESSSFGASQAEEGDGTQAQNDSDLIQCSEAGPSHSRQPVVQGGPSHKLHLGRQRGAAVKDRRALGEIAHPNTSLTRVPSPDEASPDQQDANRSQDCQPIPRSASGLPSSTYGARRLSASFSGGGPLSSNPTVASSSITAITGRAAPPTGQHQGIHTSTHGEDMEDNTLRSIGSSPILGSSDQQARYPHQHPETHSRPPSRGGADRKRLPKSRTLTVLSSLTASLSKSSLTSFTGSERKTSQQTVPSRKTSTSSTFGSSAPTRTATPTPTTTTTVDDNPLIVTTAQSSAYWTGRFVSLQDRFHGESLQEKNLSTLITAHATKATLLAQQREAYKGRGNLPLSTTTALDRYGTAAIREAKLLSDEDNRCLRIFLHLDALCGTPEAQRSLHAWQEAYALKNRRDTLLPKSTGAERGFVARLFSGSSRHGIGGSRSDKETTKRKQLLSAF
ncbi:hypothetical protein CSUB01_08700 [Colletotrichum sublineola]|uniref:Uncharacterized protein n=1 Tax=Colletotrichum sublineola TaxID=1173701 RepID=A0A066WWL9_COLSU|nr:hypothetical protein CSUB01_08700 [Colletotrichum sublineola]